MLAPHFDESFRATLSELFFWRRDVRRFRRDMLPDGLLQQFLSQACLSPSVGFSQPWRWVIVDDPERRAAVVENFQEANRSALADLSGSRAALYARLKLAGLVEAPVHLAVFIDPDPELGHGLGRRTMPEMVPYSAVCAIHTLWLAARAHGVGMGWVSILDPERVPQALNVPEHWKLIAYLCLGYPEEERDQPELEREGWAERQPMEDLIVRR
ncbi:MAG TPA: 5,6-dimethylbenzimidazole synthase [Bryobacteraceae bacterium]|nr:5,6-dimethylbenzimidazole synthase [Bryobacteraceae bacterium]